MSLEDEVNVGGSGRYEGPERRAPQPPGTAVSTALAAGASAGVAAARAAVESGSMGIPSAWRGLANSTAMVVIVFFMFLIYRDYTSNMKQDREYERTERAHDRDDRAKDREAVNSELRALTSEIRADRETQRGIADTQRGLVAELRGLLVEVRAAKMGLSNPPPPKKVSPKSPNEDPFPDEEGGP